MKRVTFVFALVVLCLGLPSLMLAEDNPAVGTWKLNLEKSKYPEGTAPKSMTRTVAVDGDNVKYSYEGTDAKGSDVKYGFSLKYDGKDYDFTGSGTPYGADHIAIKRLNSHQWKATLKKGDKVVGTTTSTVSHDGKTTTLNGSGTGPDGKMIKVTQVFDKQ
jgi:hypothetical protein